MGLPQPPLLRALEGQALVRTVASGLLLFLGLHVGAWPGLGPPQRPCVQCRCPARPPAVPHQTGEPWGLLPRVHPTVDISILKGEKSESGVAGPSSSGGKEGLPGAFGLQGRKGQNGQAGPPGSLCPRTCVAFSVGRWEGLHSTDRFQAVPFDMELENLEGAFHLPSGRFLCAVPGVYFLSPSVHTWDHKETYLHIMCNGRAAAVPPPCRTPAQRAQHHADPEPAAATGAGDAVWVRVFQRDRDNAIYGEHGDLCITFSGHLVKPATEL